MQNINLSKGGETAEKILHDRKLWYPVVSWIMSVCSSRLEKGREILIENPWGSLLWDLRCVDKFLARNPFNNVTEEYLLKCSS